jgi:hypothetical protein
MRKVSGVHQLIGLVVAFTVIGQGTARAAVGIGRTFIPAADRVDAVYDTARSRVYISTSGGQVLRYNLKAGSFASAFNLGGSLRGMALSPDGQTLVVADSSVQGTRNRIHVIDLTDDSVSQIAFNKGGYESGTYSVAFADANTVLTTSRFSGSGGVPMRKVNLTTGTAVSIANVRQDTMLATSADMSAVAYAQGNISSGPFGRYNTAAGTFEGSGTGWSAFEIGVSRDASQFAVPSYSGMFVYDYDDGFNFREKIGVYANNSPIGVVYSPIKDIMYTAWYDWDGSDDGIYAYNSNSLTRIETIDSDVSLSWVGNHAFGRGRLRISDDDSVLLATVNGGVNAYMVPEPATMLLLTAAAPLILRRGRKRKSKPASPLT